MSWYEIGQWGGTRLEDGVQSQIAPQVRWMRCSVEGARGRMGGNKTEIPFQSRQTWCPHVHQAGGRRERKENLALWDNKTGCFPHHSSLACSKHRFPRAPREWQNRLGTSWQQGFGFFFFCFFLIKIKSDHYYIHQAITPVCSAISNAIPNTAAGIIKVLYVPQGSALWLWGLSLGQVQCGWVDVPPLKVMEAPVSLRVTFHLVGEG